MTPKNQTYQVASLEFRKSPDDQVRLFLERKGGSGLLVVLDEKTVITVFDAMDRSAGHEAFENLVSWWIRKAGPAIVTIKSENESIGAHIDEAHFAPGVI